ncbi:hypothetical protein ACRTDU_19150 [Sunxiuqinia elliptica]
MHHFRNKSATKLAIITFFINLVLHLYIIFLFLF